MTKLIFIENAWLLPVANDHYAGDNKRAITSRGWF